MIRISKKEDADMMPTYISPKKVLIAAVSAGLLATVAPAQAQNTEQLLQQQKQRIDTMEGKLDRILQLLDQSQSAGAAVPAQAPVQMAPAQPTVSMTPTPAAAPVPAQIAPPPPVPAAAPQLVPTHQGLLMGVHLLQDLSSGIPDTPAGFNVASLEYNKGSTLKLSYILKNKDTKRYPFNGAIGINWNGFLKVDKSGRHLFSLDYTNIEHISNSKDCKASFGYNENKVVGFDTPILTEIKTGQVILDLSPGYHKINVWFACEKLGRREETVTDKIKSATLILKMKAPGDRMATPIPVNKLGFL